MHVAYTHTRIQEDGRFKIVYCVCVYVCVCVCVMCVCVKCVCVCVFVCVYTIQNSKPYKTDRPRICICVPTLSPPGVDDVYSLPLVRCGHVVT
jgi:hypothetical protein